MVLIASAEHLTALQEREDFAQAVAFADAEALRALDLITRQRPAVVALERLFAATSRGTALINRIKADPSLSDCEIRIVSHENSVLHAAPHRQDATSGAAAVAVAPPPPPPIPALDQRGTRRAPRFAIASGVDVQVDGNPATLLDLSVIGAQVLSPTVLRPNQRVRVLLPDSPRAVRVSAGVAWASFEIPKGTVRYRAGIEFFDADPAALTRFIDANKK